MTGQRRPLLFDLIIRLCDFEQYLTPPKTYISAILEVTLERLDRMESKQEDTMEKLCTLFNCDEPNEPMLASETPNENQDYQNNLLKGLIKLICSLPVSSSISAIKSRHPPV